MAQIITGATALDGWRGACNTLLSGGPQSNLILEIERPTDVEPSWLKCFDPRAVTPRVKRSVSDVSNTIFPQRTYERAADRHDLYRRYMRSFERGQRRRVNRSTWGTYFQRMISFGATKSNRLEEIIAALGNWTTTHRAAHYLHLSAENIDPLKPLASPCLQYIQFTEHHDHTLDLIVVVRNHDYFQKAFGNFIGLGRLLLFVATEARRCPGKLVCHSVHAYFDGTKANVNRLLARA